MPTSRPTVPAGLPVLTGLSMRDLLASCAAADVISTPPRDPEPARPEPPARAHREAA
ncbi:hypothetical protein [Streptomyces sp. NPDC007905]|uniref:hypothetical protein n=1 Tax=Streptomyces sp. NPDC007905 TaxID=3364788 RepID=UPI0036E09540